MKILIDGDILLYQAVSPSAVWKSGGLYFNCKKNAVAYNEQGAHRLFSQPNPESIRNQLKRMVADIIYSVTMLLRDMGIHKDASTIEALMYIKGDSVNYRSEYRKLIPYKENRPAKPYYYNLAKEFVEGEFNVVHADGQETDDLLGITHTALKGRSVCVSKDKDLKTIAGWNYDSWKKILIHIDQETADRYFYTQLLTGDRADNIQGIRGVGAVKAAKILENKRTPREMLLAVVEAYEKHLKSADAAHEMVDELGKLMYIRRRAGEIWSLESELRRGDTTHV